MDTARRIANRLTEHHRLRAIPIPVIEEVIACGLEVLCDIVPMGTKASELTSIDFDACEACGHLVDPEEPEGAQIDGDGIVVCAACAVDGGPEASADSVPGKVWR